MKGIYSGVYFLTEEPNIKAVKVQVLGNDESMSIPRYIHDKGPDYFIVKIFK